MKYKPEQYVKEIERRISQLRKADLIYQVATKVHADMSERIFDKGVNGDGNKIVNVGGTDELITVINTQLFSYTSHMYKLHGLLEFIIFVICICVIFNLKNFLC